MSDIFLRTRLFTDTELADPSCWSLRIEVPTGAQLDEVLLSALVVSGLRGTYQATGVDGDISLGTPMYVSFDLDLEDIDCLEVAEMCRIEMETFLAQSQVLGATSSLHRPRVQAWAE